MGVDSAGFPTRSVQCEVDPPDVRGIVFQRRRNDSRWSLSSRWTSSEDESSEVSGATLGAREGDAEGKGDSATGVTPLRTSCAAKASKGTRRSDVDSVLRILPRLRSR